MKAHATNSSKDGMDCGTPAREEMLENYLAGRLSEENREAFEEHYFGCARCFDELQTLQAIREELPSMGVEPDGKRIRMLFRWAPAMGLAAAVVLAVGLMFWMRSSAPAGVHEMAGPRLPSQADVPASSEAPASAPAVVPAPSLEQLARFEPPRFEPLRLRGVPDAAAARFQRGMEQYRKRDYAGAVADLLAAAELDPDAAHAHFFLGVSQLMLNQENAAIDSLRAAVALGDSAYLDDAHFYLAKAFLRRKDLRAAETQLKQLIQLRGPWTDEAKRLLAHVEKIREQPG